ncbi:ankyrin-repeat and fibronectin type III domain-containing 1-like isoform X2 [Dysidea avara]|uniref:ankyrin-repeat and fibronectin type III domain-containing 1-like isoform X2 n=1 Tax=Dysidea avara TaxID=196820 RepID=UPI00331A8EC9
MFLLKAFTRSHTLSSSSPYTDKRPKHRPPPITVPELSRDECFSDGELGLRGTLPVSLEHKKERKRNKSFTSVSSPTTSNKKTSSSRPRSISSHVLQRIAKNFSRRGDMDNSKVLHVFDDKDGYDSPACLGSEDSIPLGNGETSELLIDRMSINDALATHDYHRTQSMEMLSLKSTKPAGKEAHSMDDLLNERPSTPKSMGKGWGSRRKKSISMDTDVFTDVTSKSGNRKTSIDYREAIFKAVMNNNNSQVEQLLSTGHIDLTWLNSDELTTLDIAVMLNHTRIAHLLMAYGAKESSRFVRDPESRYNLLLQLITTAGEHINKYRTNLSLSSINTSTQALEEMSKLKEQWTTKKTMLQHMISVYNNTSPPDPPANVSLDITSAQSLTVRFFEPKRDNGAPVTRYRVEWSSEFNFATTDGSFVLSDLSYKLSSPDHSRYLEYTIPDLESGKKYFIRVSASNMKRFGPATYSTPAGAVPSSWHDIRGKQARYSGSTGKIQSVAMQLKQVITESSVGKDGTGTTGRGKMKRGLSKIFGGALKFHKNLKAGLYLASLVYTDDVKVLVTVDDYLPIVEVAESFNTQTIKQDFLWLSKLACTWENVKSMRDNSENYTASSSIQFRNRLLHIITDLQASLGVQDLGLIHPLPYQNSDSLVIVLVRNIKDYREIQNSSLHWAQWGKLWKKHAAAAAADQIPSTIPDQLITEAQFMMDHNSASITPVERGLYLGYLKTRSSLAGVKVVVSKQFPNLLPHTKIRDNPHISKDEWAWLTYLHQPKDLRPPDVAMETCCELQKLLTLKVTELLTSKGITNKEDIEQHRIYVEEVVELNEHVSFLLLLPPPDQVCTTFGDTDRFEQVSYMGMPFTSFEIAQLYTYQKVFITLYTQVSSTLEMELLIAQHRLREAFSNDEITKGKSLQNKLENFLEDTEQVWKDMHWLDSAVQIGRKSDTIHGVPLRSLRKNPMTSQPQSRSSSMSFTTSPEKKKELPNGQHPSNPAHFEKHISTFPEELKVTPLYDTGLTKGSTVKLHIVPSTMAIEVIQLAVGALDEAKMKRHPDKPVIPSNPNDFYLLCILNDEYDERKLDDNYAMLELYRETTKFKLFLKKKSDLDSSDCYTTSV